MRSQAIAAGPAGGVTVGVGVGVNVGVAVAVGVGVGATAHAFGYGFSPGTASASRQSVLNAVMQVAQARRSVSVATGPPHDAKAERRAGRREADRIRREIVRPAARGIVAATGLADLRRLAARRAAIVATVSASPEGHGSRDQPGTTWSPHCGAAARTSGTGGPRTIAV
jgi:hypothetical protein